ncbi:geranylgeranylglyceryl/heptaprenylglyceryl phosphate synthase [Candidatus Marsarchaeota archaeon]|nr:geranylgeranylglyceryl/heptaprenylglyceryl phosphate synthase [Candidatus Marsarchaeota archaeon]MCL5404681.1 geranylgeranylglyceryl/heptaprenylglyceryl phosphate synthase [Candidatus Marsarchaeota archaeon]
MAYKNGKVEEYIKETISTKGAMLFSVIDPVDYKTPDMAVKTAKAVAEAGADIVIIGGSIGAQGELLDYVAKSTMESISVPLVLFPGNIATITRYANAIYFMSLLNARNPYWITQAQMLSAPIIKQLSVEPLPVGYIVVSPGGTVGWVGDVNMVPREKPKIASSLALAGEYLGNRIIITDTGSNPRLQHSGPVPKEIIREVSKSISVPYVVAGGITNSTQLKAVYASGADAAQIGTAFENAEDAYKRAKLFSSVAKEQGRLKLKKK